MPMLASASGSGCGINGARIQVRHLGHRGAYRPCAPCRAYLLSAHKHRHHCAFLTKAPSSGLHTAQIAKEFHHCKVDTVANGSRRSAVGHECGQKCKRRGGKQHHQQLAAAGPATPSRVAASLAWRRAGSRCRTFVCSSATAHRRPIFRAEVCSVCAAELPKRPGAPLFNLSPYFPYI